MKSEEPPGGGSSVRRCFHEPLPQLTNRGEQLNAVSNVFEAWIGRLRIDEHEYGLEVLFVKAVELLGRVDDAFGERPSWFGRHDDAVAVMCPHLDHRPEEARRLQGDEAHAVEVFCGRWEVGGQIVVLQKVRDACGGHGALAIAPPKIFRDRIKDATTFLGRKLEEALDEAVLTSCTVAHGDVERVSGESFAPAR